MELNAINQQFIINKFINNITRNGNKNLATNIFNNALQILDALNNKNNHNNYIKHLYTSNNHGLTLFFIAIEHVKPIMLFKRVTRRKIRPYPLLPKQQYGLACKWIVQAAKKQHIKPFYHALAIELFKASNKQGAFHRKIKLYKYIEGN